VEGIKDFFDLYKKQVIFCSVIFLTSSISFGVGYLARARFNHAPIIIEKCSKI